MTTVYFATNRKLDSAAPFGFADTVADFDPQNITFGTVDVTGTNLAHEFERGAWRGPGQNAREFFRINHSRNSGGSEEFC